MKTSEGFDRHGRWRSKLWLDFVRSLPCGCSDPRCPNCSPTGRLPPTRVVAAHLRTPHTGMGMKPPDFMVYPLSDAIHRVYHDRGHPDVAWQLERVISALNAGLRRGVITVREVDDFGL